MQHITITSAYAIVQKRHFSCRLTIPKQYSVNITFLGYASFVAFTIYLSYFTPIRIFAIVHITVDNFKICDYLHFEFIFCIKESKKKIETNQIQYKIKYIGKERHHASNERINLLFDADLPMYCGYVYLVFECKSN